MFFEMSLFFLHSQGALENYNSVASEPGNSNPQVHRSSGKLGEALFTTGTVDPRVGISLSPLNTNDGFFLSLQTLPGPHYFSYLMKHSQAVFHRKSPGVLASLKKTPCPNSTCTELNLSLVHVRKLTSFLNVLVTKSCRFSRWVFVDMTLTDGCQN